MQHLYSNVCMQFHTLNNICVVYHVHCTLHLTHSHPATLTMQLLPAAGTTLSQYPPPISGSFRTSLPHLALPVPLLSPVSIARKWNTHSRNNEHDMNTAVNGACYECGTYMQYSTSLQGCSQYDLTTMSMESLVLMVQDYHMDGEWLCASVWTDLGSLLVHPQPLYLALGFLVLA